jgi:hypothetical protein
MMEEYRLLWAVPDELHISLKVVRVASANNKADGPRRATLTEMITSCVRDTSGRLSPGLAPLT